MKVKVYVDKGEISKNLDVKSIKEIISKLDLNEEEFIIVKNGELVSSDVEIKDKDELKFLSVTSAG